MPARTGSQQTVLVVDDEPIVRDVARYLRHEGYRTLEAGDGDEARRLISESEPSLVVPLLETRGGRAAGRRRLRAGGRPGRLPPDEEAAILRFLGNVTVVPIDAVAGREPVVGPVRAP